jgi:hypothetical protein
MKEQIQAARKALGAGGGLQITGGDVIDAYWREDRAEELVAVIRFAVDSGLVPMLMTHGQKLIEFPDYLHRLVVEGGLRKISCHIDITQAGRPGFPIKYQLDEASLNPLRDKLVSAILKVRKDTGLEVTAAQTVTVTEKNVNHIGEILHWLMERPENLDVTRTISFQTEAQVGRTQTIIDGVSPGQVWQEICKATGKRIVRDNLLFGHPDCSSTATLLVRPRDRRVVLLSGGDDHYRTFYEQLLNTFSGICARGENNISSLILQIYLVIRRPVFVLHFIKFIFFLFARQGLTIGFMGSVLRAKARGINIVMHNFMSAEQVQSRTPVVIDRLNACSFRGEIKVAGEWRSVPMCAMNAGPREALYNLKQSESRVQN